MQGDKLNARAIAAQEFHRARRQAAVQELLGRLTGHSAELLSYEAVARALHVRGQSSVGLQQVPIAAIVGSVGRYSDFTRTFLPRQESDEGRWVSVRLAAPTVTDLPPVELYRLGDSYFVLDGNHRVSIAIQQDVEFIDAYVTEVRTRVPLPEGADPIALIVAAEQAAFLEWSRLDQLRPESDLRVSVPGQYSHLENHIEAFRFLAEMNEGQDMDFTDAVVRWYDEAYVPLVDAIREQGILRYFPTRTETDFFIWLATHRVELQNELGIQLSPEASVGSLLSQIEIPPTDTDESLTARIRRKLMGLKASEVESSMQQSVNQTRAIARYTGRLFAGILVPVDLGAGRISIPFLQQALALAIEEGARLCIVGVVPETMAPADAAEAAGQLERDAGRLTVAIDQATDIVIESGDIVAVGERLALLYDLVVVSRAIGPGDGDVTPSDTITKLVARCHRPVLITASQPAEPVFRRAMVAIDATPQGREALFIAAYLAEQWQIALTALPLGTGRTLQKTAEHAGRYLEMHELHVEMMAPPHEVGLADVPSYAAQRKCDLLIVPGSATKGRGRTRDSLLAQLIQQWPKSLLIARWA